MDLNPQLGNFFGVKKGRGALVTEVGQDTPAARAGLMAGDVIIRVDGEKVSDADDVHDIISEMEPGDTVEVIVLRNKKEKTFSVEVTQPEDDEENWSYGYFFSPGDDDDEDEYDFRFSLPHLPKMPMMRFYESLEDYDRDIQEHEAKRDDFREEMQKLRRQLRKMQQELQELREKLD